MNIIARILDVRKYTDSDIVLGLIEFKRSALAIERRLFMPCVDKSKSARGNLQDSQPYRDKKVCLVVFADIIVDKSHDLRRRSAHTGPVVDHNVDRHHKQSRRHSFVRNIADPHGQMIVIEQAEVIEISSDFSGRLHVSIYVKIRSVGESRKFGRQRAVLYIFGKRQLHPDPLSFSRVGGQIFNIVDHVRLHLIDRA